MLAALVGAAASATVLALSDGAGRSTATQPANPASAQSPSTGTRREASNSRLTATQIYRQDSLGVVSIKAVTANGEDSGTGIVLDKQGLILTNDHVVQGAASITVSPGGSSSVTQTATLVGEEANDDLALIRVNPSGLNLKPLKLVSSSSVEVGDSVYAIGNPYGLDETLTRGIVSALNRDISAPDGANITGVLQTDAALNPGNSGGPLLNDQGEVIGVNSQIASGAANAGGSQPGSTGVGFAIASNTVAAAIKKIEAGEGVSSASATQAQAQAQGGYEARSPYGSGSPYEAEPQRPSGEAPVEEAPGLDSSESAGREEGSEVVIVP